MTAPALLTIVATLLVNHPTPVYCTHPTGHPWTDGIAGYAGYSPSRIWLRNCHDVVKLKYAAVIVFAHELLHIKHPGWAHPRVNGNEAGFAPLVLRALRRVKARVRPLAAQPSAKRAARPMTERPARGTR